MDHDDCSESPSARRRRIVEKRMEMIAQLVNKISEGENKEQESKEVNRSKEVNKRRELSDYRKLGPLINIIHRMFL